MLVSKINSRCYQQRDPAMEPVSFNCYFQYLVKRRPIFSFSFVLKDSTTQSDAVRKTPGNSPQSEGHFTPSKKRTRFFSEQKDFYGFLMDFSSKQKDFCQRRTRFFGVKCPSPQSIISYYVYSAFQHFCKN